MENETILKEMLHAFKLYSEKIDEKLDEMKNEFASVRKEMNTEFAKVNKKLDFSRERQDGGQAELMETKETIHFLHSKILQHDKILHKLSHEQ